MRRPVCPDNQIDIFPPETMAELFAHKDAPPAPKLDLPFPRNAEVSFDRVAEILDVSASTLRRLLKKNFLRHYPIAGKRVSYARIEFASLVDYCNSLRAQCDLPPCPVPPRGLRPRADDMLPFPKADTVTIDFVTERLECGETLVLGLIEDGTLRAYRFVIGGRSTWRIDVRSLEAHIQKMHEHAARPVRRLSPATR
jgi:hypothetical protein